MSDDEAFVVDRLIAHYSAFGLTSSRKGEDPPDAYLIVGDTTAAVEITRLSPIVVTSNDKIENRVTQDVFGVRLLDELDQQFRELLTDRAMMLHIRPPVKRPKKFKAGLIDLIRNFVDGAEIPSEWKEYEVDGEKIEITLNAPCSPDRKKVTGIVNNQYARPNISQNAELILENRIKVKSGICSNIRWSGPKWLALLNTYCLADERTYKSAIEKIKIPHEFSKIILVSETGSVIELWTEI